LWLSMMTKKIHMLQLNWISTPQVIYVLWRPIGLCWLIRYQLRLAALRAVKWCGAWWPRQESQDQAWFLLFLDISRVVITWHLFLLFPHIQAHPVHRFLTSLVKSLVLFHKSTKAFIILLFRLLVSLYKVLLFPLTDVSLCFNESRRFSQTQCSFNFYHW